MTSAARIASADTPRVAAEINGIVEAFTVARGTTAGRGAAENRWEAVADADLERLIGVPGTTLHTHGYLMWGRGLSSEILANQFVVSGVEAQAAMRLFDAWVETRFLDEQASMRVGRLAADDEFIISPTAARFVNGTFGWPASVAMSLSGGGPAYPSARLGMRFSYSPGEGRAFLLGVFDAPPALDAAASPGTHGTLALAEAQFASLAGETSLKVGTWRERSRPVGAYAVLDKLLWQQGAHGARRLDGFVRVVHPPRDDLATTFTRYLDAGLGFTGLLPQRPDDFVGIAAARASAPYELAVEISYAAQLASCCLVQPDVQYLRYTVASEGVSENTRSTIVVGVRVSVRMW